MVEKKEEKTQNPAANLREGNISLILDSYDDIFSDFDPRDYSVKALSDDFLNECKRAARDKKDKLELRFFVPKKKRNPIEEIMIKRRLKEHFQRHYHEKRKDLKNIRISGLLWFILGTLIMIGSVYLYNLRESSFFYTFLFIVSEPASWFFFWYGLEIIFITAKKELPDYQFYGKMAKADFYFLD